MEIDYESIGLVVEEFEKVTKEEVDEQVKRMRRILRLCRTCQKGIAPLRGPAADCL